MHRGRVDERAWYIGCALGLQPREEISIISVRSKPSAGVAYWLGIGSPVRSTEFDSPHSLHAGVAQVEEHRTRNAEVGVRIPPLAPADVVQWESSCTVSNG